MVDTEEAAYVDVLMSAHLSAVDWLVDVTWRSPFAQHSVRRSLVRKGKRATSA